MTADQFKSPGLTTFRINKKEIEASNDVHLVLEGFIDADGAPILSAALEKYRADGCLNVVLDFASVQFISSTGIGTLIAAIGEYRDQGGDVIVKGMSPELREVFETLDLLDYLTVR